jgi:pyruvate kinase
MINRLAKAGMNCARLNFSHGTLEGHLHSIKNVRRISKELKIHIAIMQDLPGPKIRVGQLASSSLTLRKGQVVTLYSDEGDERKGPPKNSNSTPIPIHKVNLARYVAVGAMIFLADGTIRLEVVDRDKTSLTCKCLNSGTLLSGKGVNIPEIQRSFQGFTDLDKKYLQFGLDNKVDLVAVSFIRTATEMENVRNFVNSRAAEPPWIISKIERREAVRNLSSVIKASDAVMVARGDLGVENPLEQVPVIQKLIISESNKLAKPVVTATQMLESMVGNPRPTRAETTDVANAVFDGTDALMLSEETAVGSYPVECVKVLDRVARVAESWEMKINEHSIEQQATTFSSPYKDHSGLGVAAARFANETRSKFIVCATASGSLARQISRERPFAEIVTISDIQTANKLEIVRNVSPVVASKVVLQSSSTRTLGQSISRILIQRKLAESGDRVVFASNVLGEKGSDKTSELLLSLKLK